MKVWDDYYKRYLAYRGRQLPRHTVNAVEKVVLPDWREQRCPWCRERALYDKWQRHAPSLPQALVERSEQLAASPRTGLTQELFLQAVGARGLFALGPDSLYLPQRANQAEVFAAVAAALQTLRTIPVQGRPLLGPRRFPVSTVLAHADYCKAKWTDSILRGSFLRAASPDELTWADPTSEAERTETLRRLITQPVDGEHEIALELLLAANEEKCSIDPLAGLEQELQAVGESETIRYLLARLADLEPYK